MKMYKVRSCYDTLIDEVEVEKFNDKSVWVKRYSGLKDTDIVTRHKRSSSYEEYFETHEDARKYLENKLISDIKSKEHSLKVYRQELETIKGMKES